MLSIVARFFIVTFCYTALPRAYASAHWNGLTTHSLRLHLDC